VSGIALAEPLVPVERIELVWRGIDHAEGLAIDGDGMVWAGGEEGQVYRGWLDGEPREVARLPGRTLGFALDADGNAYCATIAEPGVFRITPEGDVSLVSAGAPDRHAVEPNHLAFLPSATLVFSDSGAWGEDDGCIFAVTPDGASRVADTSTSRFPNGLAVLDDGRTLAVVESSLPPGFPGPVLHRHNETTDSFWVLEGTLTLRLGDDTVEAGPGTYALVPPGVVHTFSNPGDSPVRVLNLMFPGGFERYFVEASEALPADTPPDPAVLGRIAAKYDFEPAA
jgi:mannose-6-phosphate isomerase-like protein (cupin superfamily)